MRVKSDRKALQEAAALVLGVVPSKTSRPILQNFLLETRDNHLVIQGSDMEVGVSVSVEKVEVEEEGKAVVPASKVVEILSKVQEEKVDLYMEDHALHIKTSRSNFKVLGDKAEDFPAMEEPNWAEAFEIEGETLAEMVKKTIFAAATERTRYALNGIYLVTRKNKAEMVATDGKRLARIVRPVTEGKERDGVIVPTKCVNYLEKISLMAGEGGHAAVKILLQENSMFARTANSVLASRLIEGHFPDYEAVMPKSTDKVLTIDVKDLQQAVVEGSLLGDRESHAVRFNFKGGKLTLSSRSPDVGEAQAEIDVKYEGGDLDIAFNPDYVLDVLKALGGGEVKFKFKEASTAALIDPGNNYTYVVMPVSVG
jgi:DNA polymerase-3 subunit beta